MIALLAASLLSPFFLDFTPEVRTTYISLGKIVEDRPMQTTYARFGYDTGRVGRFGIYDFDVSSMTDRRSAVHQRALYHTEYGPFWDYDYEFADGWTLRNGVLFAITLYRGFENDDENGNYGWVQISQALDNPYIVPFYRMRRYGIDSDYFYFRVGLKRKFRFLDDFYITPAVCFDGGNSRNFRRVVGKRADGGDWGGGISSVTFRLEFGWNITANLVMFAFVEQYDVVGHDAREANAANAGLCTHDDLTVGGLGLRLRL